MWRAFSSIWRPLIAPQRTAEQHLALFRGEGDSPPLRREMQRQSRQPASQPPPNWASVDPLKTQSAWFRRAFDGKNRFGAERKQCVIFFLSGWVFIVDAYACVLHRTGEKAAPEPQQIFFRSGRLRRGTRSGGRAPRALAKPSEPWTTAGW